MPVRFDSDSLLVTPMQEDPFRRLQKSGGKYVWRAQNRDMDFVVVGMWEFIDEYVGTHASVPGLRRRVDDTRLVKSITEDHMDGIGGYSTNFEIMHLPSFRRPDVADWLAHLRANDEGFYKWRWGESWTGSC